MPSYSKPEFGWMPLTVICMSMLALYFLASGINVIIAKVCQDLQTDVGTIQLSLVLASLVSGSLMITAGKLGNKFGKKKILLLGLSIFLVGALIALLAPNATIFVIAWGFIWPLGMVLIVPTTVAMVTYYYEGARRALAFGIYGAVASLAVTLGPLVIGFLADTVPWRWAMSLSPVLTVLTLLLALKIPETSCDRSIKIDIFSVTLSFLSLAIFLIAMMLGGTYGFFMAKRPFTLGDQALPLAGLSIVVPLLVVSAILLWTFFKRCRDLLDRKEEALLNPALFKNAVYRSGMLAQTALYLVIPANAFALPLFLQSINAFTPSQTAITMLPGTATLALVAFFSPSLGKYLAPKWIVVSGFFITLVSTFLIVNGLGHSKESIQLFLPLVIFGIGTGLVMAQIANITLSAVEPEETGEASGLAETFKEAIGGGFGIALVSTLLLASWHGSFIDKQMAFEEVTLSSEERKVKVIEIEDTIADSGEVINSTYYKAMPAGSQKRFGEFDFSSGRDGIANTMWLLRGTILLALLLCLQLPNIKLE